MVCRLFFFKIGVCGFLICLVLVLNILYVLLVCYCVLNPFILFVWFIIIVLFYVCYYVLFV